MVYPGNGIQSLKKKNEEFVTDEFQKIMVSERNVTQRSNVTISHLFEIIRISKWVPEDWEKGRWCNDC